MSPYGLLAGFVAALEIALGLGVLVGGMRALVRLRSAPGDLAAHESRRTLLLAAGGVLGGLVVAGLPLLHLHFQTMVPEWPGIRCVEGITRIGKSSRGTTAWLPGIARTIEVLKVAALIACGAFVVLHRVDRRMHAARLGASVLVALTLGGLAALLDGAAALAWLIIPKVPEIDTAGCCSNLVDAFIAMQETTPRVWSAPVHLGLVALLAAGAAWQSIGGRAPRGGRALAIVSALAALAAIPTGRIFLADVAAPLVLGLPHHLCLWCLAAQAPESVVAAALLLAGCSAAIWGATLTCVTAPDADSAAAPTRGMLRQATALLLAGYLVMILTGWLSA